MSESKDFGNVAVELGFITEAELRKYLDLQRLLKERGIDEPLEKILVQEEAITSLDARAIAQQIPGKTSNAQQSSTSIKTPITEKRKASTTRREAMQNATTIITPIAEKRESPTNRQGETQALGNQTLSKFGRYQIQKVLGQGGVATVYKVHDPHLDREAALKVLTLGQVANQTQLQRFSLEIKTTAKLQHPGIVTIYETGVENKIPYFVMDYIQGTNLKQYIYRYKPSIQEAISIIKTVATAIGYAHSQGVIHRDLKPENIMMDEEKNPRVMDFGLAKLKDDDTGLSRTGEILGTVKYMSPEQAEGIKDVDERTDVYALGAIFYEILAKQPPFEGKSYLQILNQVINNQPQSLSKINPEIPRDLELICLKALKKKADNRYRNAAKFVEALENFSAGKSTATSKKITKRTTQRVITERRRPVKTTQRMAMKSSRVTQRIALQKKNRRDQNQNQMVAIIVLAILVFILLMILLSSNSSDNYYSEDFNNNSSNARVDSQKNDYKKNNSQTKDKSEKTPQQTAKKEVNLQEEAKEKLAKMQMLPNAFAMWNQLNSFDEKYKDTPSWQVVQHHKRNIEKGLSRELSTGLILLESNRQVPDKFWQSFDDNRHIIEMISQQNVQIKIVMNKLLTTREKLNGKRDTPQQKNLTDENNAVKNTGKATALNEEQHNLYFHSVLTRHLINFQNLDDVLRKIQDPILRQQVKLRFDAFAQSSVNLQRALREALSAMQKISLTLKFNRRASGKITKIKARQFTIQTKKYNYLTISANDMVKILGKKATTLASILAIHFFHENDFAKAKKYWDLADKNTLDYDVWKRNLAYFHELQTNLQLKVRSTPIISKIEQTIPIVVKNIGKQDQSAVTVAIDSLGEFRRKTMADFPKESSKYVALPFTVTKAVEYPVRVTLSIKKKTVKSVKIKLKAERKKYGFYSDAWQKLHYRHNGHEILDMTSPYWMKLSDSKKEDYAKTYQKYYAKSLGKKETKTISIQGTKLNMAFVPPGRFWLGSSDTERGRNVKEIRHKVVISKAFWIQKEEMPQITWQKIAATTPWKGKESVKSGPIYPATYLSFNRIKSDLLTKLGQRFDIPTEAQWEYACRAGSTTAFYWGNSYKRAVVYSWSKSNSKKHPAIVRRKRPNSWGLYDMLGNVAEICRDSVRNYDTEQQIDPFYNPSGNSQRILRGGHYGHQAQQLRSAMRQNVDRSSYSHVTGMRLIMYEE
ncbi:bifunctional serine/threonine-protein kinase/formylglycine-generating enzyme family protein [Candidatus Uabimicrobium amorphum]|nr:bifunctional serine/threonine-protein kinase/formylglycine-generating enzyme family protein [Candidatus Uabimicrobium amorphum]